MDSDSPIFEVRRHSLMGAIVVSAMLSIVYVIYLLHGFHSPFEEAATASQLTNWIYDLQLQHPIISSLVVGLGTFVVSFKVGQIASRFNLYGTVSHLPMELYPLLVMGVMINLGSLRVLIISVLMTYSISRFFSSYRSSNSSGQLVSGAISLGLIIMLYPPLITLWVVMPFLLILFERTLREVIVATFAIFIVPLTQLYVLWIIGETTILESINIYVDSLLTPNNFHLVESFNWFSVAMLAIVLYIFISAIFVISLLDNTVKARRRLHVIALYAIAIGVTVLIPSTDTSIFGIIALPIALLAPVTLLKFNRLVSFAFYVALFICGALTMFMA